MRPQKIILLTAIILTTLHTTAQNQPFQIGIQTGPSMVFLKGNPILDTLKKNKLSFSIGLPIQYNINTSISITTGIYYQRKGTALKTQMAYSDSGTSIGKRQASVNMDYITIPVMLRTYFGENIKFFINTGPYFSYLLKNTTLSKLEAQPQISTNYTANYKRLDIGLTAGLGVETPLQQNLNGSFEIRTSTGLTNTSKIAVANNGEIKTNTLEFLLGIAYKIGK